MEKMLAWLLAPAFDTTCVILEIFLASLSPNLCKKEACSHQGASQL